MRPEARSRTPKSNLRRLQTSLWREIGAPGTEYRRNQKNQRPSSAGRRHSSPTKEFSHGLLEFRTKRDPRRAQRLIGRAGVAMHGIGKPCREFLPRRNTVSPLEETMLRFLIIFLIFVMPAFAQDAAQEKMIDALNNLQEEVSVCWAYYGSSVIVLRTTSTSASGHKLRSTPYYERRM